MNTIFILLLIGIYLLNNTKVSPEFYFRMEHPFLYVQMYTKMYVTLFLNPYLIVES